MPQYCTVLEDQWESGEDPVTCLFGLENDLSDAEGHEGATVVKGIGLDMPRSSLTFTGCVINVTVTDGTHYPAKALIFQA